MPAQLAFRNLPPGYCYFQFLSPMMGYSSWAPGWQHGVHPHEPKGGIAMLEYRKMSLPRGLLAVTVGLSGALFSTTQASADEATIEHGRYIAQIAGCNDCHTAGYLMSGGEIPESQWLTGDSFGWNGPWGTTYAANLRLFVQDLSEDQWVEAARNLRRRPPMPWFNLNRMNERDLRALYQFVRSLGDPGLPAPAYLEPGITPPQPYAQFPSPPAAEKVSAAGDR